MSHNLNLSFRSLQTWNSCITHSTTGLSYPSSYVWEFVAYICLPLKILRHEVDQRDKVFLFWNNVYSKWTELHWTEFPYLHFFQNCVKLLLRITFSESLRSKTQSEINQSYQYPSVTSTQYRSPALKQNLQTE